VAMSHGSELKRLGMGIAWNLRIRELAHLLFSFVSSSSCFFPSEFTITTKR
jgi:hypothetical protein